MMMQLSENQFFKFIKNEIVFILGFSLLFFAFTFTSVPVLAHHPWEGERENLNLFQAFISGLAHPILGLDHLLFFISVGLLGGLSPLIRVPFLITLGLLSGIASLFLPIFPGSEILMGVSIIFSVLVALKRLPLVVIPISIACHGFVLAKAMIGLEPTPLISYFIGVLLVEIFIIYCGRFIFKNFWQFKKIILGILFVSGLTLTSSVIF